MSNIIDRDGREIERVMNMFKKERMIAIARQSSALDQYDDEMKNVIQENKNITLLEATFFSNGKIVRTDILEKKKGEVHSLYVFRLAMKITRYSIILNLSRLSKYFFQVSLIYLRTSPSSQKVVFHRRGCIRNWDKLVRELSSALHFSLSPSLASLSFPNVPCMIS